MQHFNIFKYFNILKYFFSEHNVTSVRTESGWENDDFIYDRYRVNMTVYIDDKAYRMQFIINKYEGLISDSMMNRLLMYKAAKEMSHRLRNAHVAHPDFIEHLGTVEYFKK